MEIYNNVGATHLLSSVAIQSYYDGIHIDLNITVGNNNNNSKDDNNKSECLFAASNFNIHFRLLLLLNSSTANFLLSMEIF